MQRRSRSETKKQMEAMFNWTEGRKYQKPWFCCWVCFSVFLRGDRSEARGAKRERGIVVRACARACAFAWIKGVKYGITSWHRAAGGEKWQGERVGGVRQEAWGRERERERGRERESGGGGTGGLRGWEAREGEKGDNARRTPVSERAWKCVCVTQKEREREREKPWLRL